jgi:hypothetical protein
MSANHRAVHHRHQGRIVVPRSAAMSSDVSPKPRSRSLSILLSHARMRCFAGSSFARTSLRTRLDRAIGGPTGRSAVPCRESSSICCTCLDVLSPDCEDISTIRLLPLVSTAATRMRQLSPGLVRSHRSSTGPAWVSNVIVALSFPQVTCERRAICSRYCVPFRKAGIQHHAFNLAPVDANVLQRPIVECLQFGDHQPLMPFLAAAGPEPGDGGCNPRKPVANGSGDASPCR